MKIRFLLLFLLITSACISQNARIDSLKEIIKTAKNDTTRIKALKAWEDIIYISDAALDLKLNKQIEELCITNLKKQLSDKEIVFYNHKYAVTLDCMGNIYSNQGDNIKAIEYYTNSMKIFEKDDKKGVASVLNNIGLVYVAQGNNAKAIDYYTRSLKILEDLGDQSTAATILNNIGNIYCDAGNYTKAMDYQNRALKIEETINDKMGIAISTGNLGNIYSSQKMYAKAIEMYSRSLKIEEAIGDKRGVATSLNCLGTTYSSLGDQTNTIDYYKLGLKIDEEINDKDGISSSLNNIGTVYLLRKDYPQAIDYFTRSLKIAQEIGNVVKASDASQNLYQTYKRVNKDKEALAMHELYIQMRDSINSEQSKKEIVRQEFKYQYEKRATADSVHAVEEKKVIAAQFKQEKTQRYALYGGLLFLIVFGGFMFNRFRVTTKQKHIIEKQKELVEEKQKEVLDSIYYARRIQKALLPTEKYIDKSLKRLNKNS